MSSHPHIKFKFTVYKITLPTVWTMYSNTFDETEICCYSMSRWPAENCEHWWQHGPPPQILEPPTAIQTPFACDVWQHYINLATPNPEEIHYYSLPERNSGLLQITTTAFIVNWLDVKTQPNRFLFWTRIHIYFRMQGILTKLSATTWQAIGKKTQQSRYNSNGAIKLNRDWSLANTLGWVLC